MVAETILCLISKVVSGATAIAKRAKRRASRRKLRVQQLGLAQRGQRGGYRAGAGRPKGSRTSNLVPHRTRPRINKHQASHVTVKVLTMRRSLRSPRAREALEAIFTEEKRRKGFRLLHYSIRRNHIHLVCESNFTAALSRGMQRLCSRIARRINKLWGRSGRFFADRYHGRVIISPRDMRNVLRYVLLNLHKDALIEGGRFMDGGFDPCSSARWFDGWHPAAARPPPKGVEPTVTEPLSWLAARAWRKRGLLRPSEIAQGWIEARR